MTGFDALVRTGLVERDVVLGSLTTYKLGGPAQFYAEVDSVEELDALAGAWSAERPEILVVGRGSNLVISDAGWPGLAIRFGSAFATVELGAEGRVRAGAATSLPKLAREMARAGRGGLEFFVGIPGSVGGAIRMNAGGHGSQTADWLVEAEVYRLEEAKVDVRPAADLEFGYRSSALAPGELVLSALFKTVATEAEEAEAKLREITRWRRTYQPGGTLNAGSVFRNPPGDAAGRIIDELGLKGFRVGGAAVSRKHANFFEADPGASAQDVYDLVHAVRAIVADKTGVELTPEVQFAGRFQSPPS